MKLSRLDKVIVVLPVLGLFDVLSTLYIAWRGYPMIEAGLFASYFARQGLLHLYIFIYLGILTGIAAILLFIKREVGPQSFFDGLVFLLLVATVCFLEAFLVDVIVSNFLVGSYPQASLGMLPWVIYLSMFVAIMTFVWDELKGAIEAIR